MDMDNEDMEVFWVGAVLSSLVWLAVLILIYMAMSTNHKEELVRLGVAHWEVTNDRGATKFVIDAPPAVMKNEKK